MVLNALSIDPKRPWKGSWRWFHEELLDCCLPLSKVAQEGVVLTQVRAGRRHVGGRYKGWAVGVGCGCACRCVWKQHHWAVVCCWRVNVAGERGNKVEVLFDCCLPLSKVAQDGVVLTQVCGGKTQGRGC